MNDKFLCNNNCSFINKIKYNLSICRSFCFSVSFIKKAGLILLEREIIDALKRGSIGKIITSTYQNFTDIPSLDTFMSWSKEYPNFECHLDYNCFNDNGFHTKGYLFEYDNSKELIIGSNNITRYALLKNVEWSLSILSKDNFSSMDDASIEFSDLWNKTLPISNELINKYKVLLDFAIEKWDMDYFNPDINVIKPNTMQRKALKEISRNRDMGVTKALVVAATGSGKTYLAAFDAKNFNAKRLLFVVHRDTILNDAKVTFTKVFGATRSYGLYTGNEQNLEAEFIFASNTMLSRHLDLFSKKEFDYIVIDECHHASAETYKKIMNYFEPSFILGLTATPERMDNEDIFELFERNLPFELRLRDAIINNLVVPFHYYGIRDVLANYKYKDNSLISREIAKSDNVEFIASQIEIYRLKNQKLKAIAFCTSISHAKTMANALNNYGYSTLALTGFNDTGERIKAFNNLQDDSNSLELICTVDILNEGVDIPQINMVLFLRPTESQTIFLQQLGRGLRLYEGKEYLTVLDFIGNNYDRSVQIAMALGTLGTNTGIEKAYLREMIMTDFKSLYIPGVEINIDSLSKEEIINNIERANFNRKDFLYQDFENFRRYIKCETYPSHMDYLNCDCAPDLMRFIKAKINGRKSFSYYSFLSKIGVESIPVFNQIEIDLINKLSDLLPLSRPDEYLIVKQILDKNKIELNSLLVYNSRININTLNNASFHLVKDKIIIEDRLNINKISDDLKDYLNDLVEYGLTRCEIEFGEFDTPFKIYGNYYKEQIMKELLEETTMFLKGTKFDDNHNVYCFVGLKKDKPKQERTFYKDKFISKKVFQWESENNTTINNETGKKLLSCKTVYLFVRKMDEEDGITLPFTYFGTGRFDNVRESFVEVVEKDGTTDKKKTLLFDIILDKEVDDSYCFEFEVPEVE